MQLTGVESLGSIGIEGGCPGGAALQHDGLRRTRPLYCPHIVLITGSGTLLGEVRVLRGSL